MPLPPPPPYSNNKPQFALQLRPAATADDRQLVRTTTQGSRGSANNSPSPQSQTSGLPQFPGIAAFAAAAAAAGATAVVESGGGGDSPMSRHTPPRRVWSPDPELPNGAMAKAYRNDPYRALGTLGKVFCFSDEDLSLTAANHNPTLPSEAVIAESQAPEGTRHGILWGRVPFVPYPTTEFHPPQPQHYSAHHDDEQHLVRVFIGQLPYFVTDMQLAWLCHTFGGGGAVMYPERIMKRQASGERMPTGCIHAYATPAAIQTLIQGLDKRLLIDDTGVWYARTHEERDVLASYVQYIKANRTARPPNRPYDSVVVQQASSQYYPAHHTPLAGSGDGWAAVSPPVGPPMPPPPEYAPPEYTMPPCYADAMADAAPPLPPPPYYGAAM